MINKLKEYVKNNATLLFKTDEKNNLEAIFDSKGFWFHSRTQTIYDIIKSKPHLYVAFTEDGYIYIGISNQIGGRWKRQHAYHLGTLAYHLLGTIRNDDQNHKHWIEAWMDTKTLKINNKLNSIELKKTVHICFIPFELYAGYNNYHQGAMLPPKTTTKLINKEVETALIQSYKLDGYKLLNVQKTTKEKKPITKSGVNKTPPPNIPSVAISADSIGGDNYRNNKCVEFKITNNDNIALVAAANPNLPVGPCTIELFYKNKTDVRRYINGGARCIRKINRSVSDFFRATDLINGINIQKYQIVYNEMNDPNRIIEEITVRVCPIN